MNKPVRVRFAPSPTGLLHIGSARAALFNYLFAKHHNGTFILRIEDTDRERFVEGSVEQIVDGLSWLGIEPDEGFWNGEHIGKHGPYVQSHRLEHYQAVAQQLIDQGLAYYSYISNEDFAKAKQDAIDRKQPFVYREEFEPKQKPAASDGYPIRLRIPKGRTKWSDIVYGDFDVDNATVDDFVILKADGYPTYNFANVIDDHMMEISHVIRGPEFLPSTPKHAILYDLLEWVRPKFVHVPVILGPDGKKKLSKRDGDVDLMDYKKQGFLPEAIVNFLVLLGWNDGTEREFFTLEELVGAFDATRIQRSPAKFDIERLRWMNGHYIREGIELQDLTERLVEYVPQDWLKNEEYFIDLVALDRERIKTLADAQQLLEFFFVDPHYSPELFAALPDKDAAITGLTATLDILEGFSGGHHELEKALRNLAESHNIAAGKLFGALRIAITGRTQAPGIFDTILMVGTERSVERIRRFLSILRKQ